MRLRTGRLRSYAALLISHQRQVIDLLKIEPRCLHRSAIALAALLAMCTIPAVTRAQGADAAAPLPNVLCASKAGERQSCPADTRKGVELVRSSGPGACELGRTWGYDQEAIWVAEGCSAEFALGTQAQAQPEKKPIGNYVPRAG